MHTNRAHFSKIRALFSVYKKRQGRPLHYTTLHTFGGSAVFKVKVVSAFKTETAREQKTDLTIWTQESNGAELEINIYNHLVIQQE